MEWSLIFFQAFFLFDLGNLKLLDSILNEFDLPKLYFHVFPKMKVLPALQWVNFGYFGPRRA